MAFLVTAIGIAAIGSLVLVAFRILSTRFGK